MNYLKRASIISYLFISNFLINPVSSQNITINNLSNELEKSLNQNTLYQLKALFIEESFQKFKRKHEEFNKDYKHSKWKIKPITSNEVTNIIGVNITSTRYIGNQKYNLFSKQIVQIETSKNKIKSYQVIDEESILKTYDNPLKIQINYPKEVLTGEKYEFDLIIEEPIDNSFTAGGMITIEDFNTNNSFDQLFGIKISRAGGLFKSIKAPLKPGFQTISAIIAHPKGIYTITKKFNVTLSSKNN